MTGRVLNFPLITDKEGAFLTKFDWLLSDYDSNDWNISDPVSTESIITSNIKFDGVLAPGLMFSDRPSFIEDIKRSLVFAVEVSRHVDSFGAVIGSHGPIRHLVTSFKRIYREIFDMGLSGLDQVTSEDLLVLIERLQFKEFISQRYEQKLSDYFDNSDLNDLPLSIRDDRKCPSSIDVTKVCNSLGINIYSYRFSNECKKLISRMNQQLSVIYSGYQWDVGEIDIGALDSNFVNVKCFITSSDLLIRLHAQSGIEGVLSHPLNIDPLVHTKKISQISAELEKNDERRGRTRNIPVEDFLTLGDRAARWVLDYSEPLFELEEKALAFFDKNSAYSEPGKLTASWLREETQNHPLSKAKGSPFPLSGFKKNQAAPNIKHDSDTSFEVMVAKDNGFSDAKTGSELGLTKSQVRHIRTRDTKYNRDLDNTGVTLATALYNYLPLACVIIILSFTAGRESGVYSLKPGSIRKRLGRRYINMYVPKTRRTYDDFPTVSLVEKSVAILERLSSRARYENNSESLFEYKSPIMIDGSGKFCFDRSIVRFCDFLGLNSVDENGEPFKFSEHQFRRFFAIMYFYRYDCGDFEALAHHLRHTDWSMTSIYLSEKEAGLILAQVEKERIEMAAKKSALMIGDEYSGPMASTFSSQFEKSLNLEDEDEYDWAEEFVKKDDLVFDFIPPGLCFGRTPGYESRANCKISDGEEWLIRYHMASEEVCSDCPNFLGCKSVKANHAPYRKSDNVFSCDSDILNAALAKGEVIQ